MTDATEANPHAAFDCPGCGERHPLPRDPSAYRPTDHFYQRYQERAVPEGAIADCLRGTFKTCANANSRFAEGECVDGQRWRFVFAPDATDCPEDGGTLPALTIYPVAEADTTG